MNRLLFAVAGLLVSGVALAGSPAFYDQAKGKGIGVIAHEFAKTYGPGSFEAKVSVFNLKDSALRGELRVVVGDKAIATAPIDLPPKQLSEAVQELTAKGKIEKDAKGGDIKIVLAVGSDETVCYSGKIGDRTELVKAEKTALPRFNAEPGEVKFVKSVPLAEGPKAREFVEKGGVLVVAPIKSAEDLAFAQAFVSQKALPNFKAQKGRENAYDTVVNPGAFRLFDWPYAYSETLSVADNRLRGGGREWLTVQQGYTMAIRIGSGALIVSVLPLEDTDWFRDNLKAHCALEAEGIRFGGLSHEYNHFEDWKNKSGVPTVAGGSTTLSLKNINEATTNLNLALQMTITAENGESRTVLARHLSKRIGEDFRIAVSTKEIALSGPCHAKYELFDWDSQKHFTLAEMDFTLPDCLEVVPPHFRNGIVSTARKTAAITVGINVNRREPNLGGKKWKLLALDAAGEEVAAAEGVFADGARGVTAALPFAKDAPAGTYALVATVGDKTAKSELRIVAPEKGQIIVDQDGYLLHEGKPHLPLGIYHCHSFNLTKPIDETGLRAIDMGFDWMQMWEWDYNCHISLDREIVEQSLSRDGSFKEATKDFTKEQLAERFDRKLEENRQSRELLKKAGMYICFEGFGIWEQCFLEHPGRGQKFSFEKDERIPKLVSKMAADPDQLVRMYYLADEAGGNFNNALSRASKLLSKYDTHLHPTFNLGNLPAVMAGDFGGLDCYRRYYGGLGSVMDVVNALDEQRRQLAPFQMRPFLVPQAFGQSPEQPTETPEYVRIQVYLALIHGASGIGFYCWQQTGDWSGKHRQGMSWNPPTAHAVKKLISEIRVFEQALMTPGAKSFISKDGNVHAILCGNEENGRYLVCANAFELPVDTVLPVEGVKDLKLEPLFGAPEAKDALSVNLPGWGTAVWRIK